MRWLRSTCRDSTAAPVWARPLRVDLSGADDFLGCTSYPWSTLKIFPILQHAVLLNPLVYASDGGSLVPQFPHLSLLAVLGDLTLFDVLLLAAGLWQFHRKAVD